MNPNTEAFELRRALELLARKHSPPHEPTANVVQLASLGTSELDLTTVPLAGAWLRGLDFGAATLSSDAANLEAAVLDDADLQAVNGLEDVKVGR